MSLNETKIYVVDELKHALKNNPEVKFQREKKKSSRVNFKHNY